MNRGPLARVGAARMESVKLLWFAATCRPVGGGRHAVLAVLPYPTLDCADACCEGMARSCGHECLVWPAPPDVDETEQRREASMRAAVREEVVRRWGEQAAEQAEANARIMRTAPHLPDLPTRRMFAAGILRGDAADVAVVIVRADGAESALISRNSTGRLKAALGRAQRAAAPRARASAVDMCDNDRR